MSERSGARERSEPGKVSKRVIGASKHGNGRVSGLVLQSGFLVDLAHSVSFEGFNYACVCLYHHVPPFVIVVLSFSGMVFCPPPFSCSCFTHYNLSKL